MLCLFVWFDSLRLINNLSVMKGRVFLGCTSTKLRLMFLLKDTKQWRRWGSNPRPLGLESSLLPLCHCAPTKVLIILTENWKIQHFSYPELKRNIINIISWVGSRVLGESYTGCVLNVTEYWWSVFGCSLLLTCTETGESRFLSPLRVKHRKTNPNITEKLLTESKNSNMYKRARKFIR